MSTLVHVLIVDDDPVAVELMKRSLPDNVMVSSASNGTDAWRAICLRPPTLILLDANLPGESGFSICERVKQDVVLQAIPIIFVTNHNDIAFEREAMARGADDFLAKPISPPRVKLRVALHLRLRRQVDELRRLASVDELTGLANRRHFDSRLKEEWNRAHRNKSPISMVLIDVDYFKAFNDTYGHVAGDECLAKVGKALKSTARRPADFVARLGGEEFALLLGETSQEGAIAVAQSVRNGVRACSIPHAGSRCASQVTVSVGVCTFDMLDVGPQTDERALMQLADQALYMAKGRGRDRVELAFVPAQIARAE